MRLLTTIVCAFLIAGCSGFVSAPEKHPSGNKVVLVLVDASTFKTAVIGGIREPLTEKGYTLIVDDVKRARYYPASDYAAVVYMAEYWAWHVPFGAKRYFERNDRAGSIVFFITAGDPDVTIEKPFDAVTSTSQRTGIATASQELLRRLAPLLR